MLFLNRIREKNKDLLKKENLLFLTLSIMIFFIDRITKLKILTNFSDETFFINDYLNIDLIWNIGIGFGFLSTDSFLIYSLVSILIGLIILFLIYAMATSQKVDKFIYSIIIGGALGNFYDRLTFKAVPDFIDLHYNNFHWFTFNVADIFITFGIIIFVIRSFFVKS
tara:strand:+ start:1153 stop:1653 length:501 start_codon:yes stop_codon:yes gene_type:complete